MSRTAEELLSDGAESLPLFPLHTVLFPGGPLAVRVFEARYLDMVGRCLRDGSGFGVVLIREGNEVGRAAETHPLGTMGRISYWERRPDGLLGITLRGERRFRILDTEVAPDQLLKGRVEYLPAIAPQPVPRRFAPLVAMLRDILEQLDHPYVTLPRHYDDAAWVAARLTELLPLPSSRKQQFLAIDEPYVHLQHLQAALAAGEFR